MNSTAHQPIADRCDITTGVSKNENASGVTDECEGQRAQGGGSGGSSATGGSTATTSVTVVPEHWAALYEWSANQTWSPASPLSGTQQFQRYIDKRRALGLPIAAVEM